MVMNNIKIAIVLIINFIICYILFHVLKLTLDVTFYDFILIDKIFYDIFDYIIILLFTLLLTAIEDLYFNLFNKIRNNN